MRRREFLLATATGVAGGPWIELPAIAAAVMPCSLHLRRGEAGSSGAFELRECEGVLDERALRDSGVRILRGAPHYLLAFDDVEHRHRAWMAYRGAVHSTAISIFATR